MRRRFGRGPFGSLRRMIMDSIPPLLRRSNELLAAGQYAAAADGLEQLARAAHARGGRRGSRRAAFLYLEAGQARLNAAQPAQALDLIQIGLGLMAASGLDLRLGIAARRLIVELDQAGFKQEAQQLTGFAGNLAQGLDRPPDILAVPKRPMLPTHCPGCGAPVRPDEIEWLDEITAECDYCGSPVRGSS